jgi:hypothetical protein
MPQTLEQIMASLSGQYDPQAKLIQDQQAALPGQETAAIAGADAAKNNAFTQNQNNANSMGMMYSGQGLENNNKYIGERYAPAIAGIKQNTQQQGYQLQNALLGVRQQQGAQAQGIYTDQVNREQQQRQYEQQRQDGIDQFNRQLAAQQQQAAAAQRAAAASQASQATRGFSVARDKSGGYAIKAPDGSAATLAQYAGGNVGAVVQYLAQGSSGDQALAKKFSQMNLGDPKVLTTLQKQYPYIFGGV